MLRIKAYHKTEKRMYKVAKLDYMDRKIHLADESGETKIVEIDVVILFCKTPYFVLLGDKKKQYIFDGDFLVANLGEQRISGVVTRKHNGLWLLKNKKTGEKIPLYFLFKENWTILNFKNAYMYFHKKKKV